MQRASQIRDFRVNRHADGTARDTYVQSGNGGLLKPYSPVRYPEVSTFRIQNVYNPPSPILKPRGVYYHSDGKGRDSYIESNSGGLNGFCSLPDATQAFKKSLRT